METRSEIMKKRTAEKMLIEIAKTIIAKIINAGLHVLFILPRKKNRIVFIPSNGHYYCNLKYIDQFLRKEKADVEIIWGRKQAGDASYPGEVECLSRYSLSFLRYFCTASVVFSMMGSHPGWKNERGRYGSIRGMVVARTRKLMRHF